MKMTTPHFTTQPIGFKILLEYDWRRKYRNVFSKMLTTSEEYFPVNNYTALLIYRLKYLYSGGT
jgi:hypothetical protein